MVLKKADITIDQIVVMEFVHKKLKKNQLAHKVPSIPQSLNAIAVQQVYDPIIDVACMALCWDMFW